LAGAAALAIVGGGPALAADTRGEFQISFGWAPAHRTIADQSYDGSLGVALNLRSGRFVAGPLLDMTWGYGRVLDTSTHLGATAGYAPSVAKDWRLELLGEGGVHHVFDVRQDRDYGFFVGVNQRDTVILPYVGVRGGVTWEYRRSSKRGFLGSRSETVELFLYARRDLGSGTAVVDYTALWSDPTTVSYDVGGWSAGTVLAASIGW
jgi:hypothetical protein